MKSVVSILKCFNIKESKMNYNFVFKQKFIKIWPILLMLSYEVFVVIFNLICNYFSIVRRKSSPTQKLDKSVTT